MLISITVYTQTLIFFIINFFSYTFLLQIDFISICFIPLRSRDFSLDRTSNSRRFFRNYVDFLQPIQNINKHCRQSSFRIKSIGTVKVTSRVDTSNQVVTGSHLSSAKGYIYFSKFISFFLLRIIYSISINIFHFSTLYCSWSYILFVTFYIYNRTDRS